VEQGLFHVEQGVRNEQLKLMAITSPRGAETIVVGLSESRVLESDSSYGCGLKVALSK